MLYVGALGNEKLNRRGLQTGFTVADIESNSVGRDPKADVGRHIGTITAAMLIGALGEFVLAWLNGVIDIGRDQLAADAAELVQAMRDTAALIEQRRR